MAVPHCLARRSASDGRPAPLRYGNLRLALTPCPACAATRRTSAGEVAVHDTAQAPEATTCPAVVSTCPRAPVERVRALEADAHARFRHDGGGRTPSATRPWPGCRGGCSGAAASPAAGRSRAAPWGPWPARSPASACRARTRAGTRSSSGPAGSSSSCGRPIRTRPSGRATSSSGTAPTTAPATPPPRSTVTRGGGEERRPRRLGPQAPPPRAVTHP
jgi:hypothetical protein